MKPSNYKPIKIVENDMGNGATNFDNHRDKFFIKLMKSLKKFWHAWIHLSPVERFVTLGIIFLMLSIFIPVIIITIKAIK